MKKILVVVGMFFFVFSSFANFLAPSSINVNAANVTGTVFQDYNSNGVYDTTTTANNQGFGDHSLAVDKPVQGIAVTAYDNNNNVIGSSQTTNLNGEYTLTGITGNARIEFTGYQALGYESSAVGSSSNSSVQFVDATPGNLSNINFAVNKPKEYCQNNPTVITNCYVPGHRILGDFPNNPALVDFKYSAGSDRASVSNASEAYEFDQANTHDLMLKNSDIGTTWGIAKKLNNDNSHEIYSAAYLKRGSDFGPGGPGAIYSANFNGTTATTPTILANLNAGLSPHPDSETVSPGPGGDCNPVNPALANYIPAGGKTCWFHDPYAFLLIGKLGLGDMDISEDGQTLFVMNLFDRNLYKINSTTGTVLGNYVVPGVNSALPGVTQNCPSGDVRPFATGYHEGLVYIGITCSAESTQNTNDLQGYIYTFDPNTNNFSSSPVLEYELGITRSAGSGGGALASWRPWLSGGGTNSVNLYPMPLISDIEFDSDENMIIGLKDIFGDRKTNQQGGSTNTSSTFMNGNVFAQGDIMRACRNLTAWDIEGSVISCPQGTNRGHNEFFGGDNFVSLHTESSIGGLAIVPGFQDVMTSQMDPTSSAFSITGEDTFQDQGIRWLSLVDGSYQKAYRLVDDDQNPANFGKGNGIGDIEVLCSSAPIEIGNRIWIDNNGNGVQDAGEPAIPGVTVNLYNPANIIIGTAITDINGNYYFSSNTGTDTSSSKYGLNILRNTNNYRVSIDPTQSALSSYKLTSTNSDGSGNGDSRDNDATLVSPTNASVVFNTGSAGQNTHTFDIGFAPVPDLAVDKLVDGNSDSVFTDSEILDTPGLSGNPDPTTFQYQLKVTNESTLVQATGVEATDLIPAGVTITSGTATQGSITTTLPLTGGASGSNLVWNIGTLAPNQVVTLILNANLASANQTAFVNYFSNASSQNIFQITAMNDFDIDSQVNNATIPGFNPATSQDDEDDARVTIPPTIGNFVWEDLNVNGLQDEGEPGIAGVTVNLYQDPGGVNTLIASVVTGSDGSYYFGNLTAGVQYQVEFVHNSAPTNYVPTSQNQGGSDVLDSDGDIVTGRSQIVTLVPGEVNDTIDQGYYSLLSLGNLVWEDYNNNGVVDSGETGIGGVTVTLYNDVNNNGVLDSTDTVATQIGTGGLNPGESVTDVNGNYRFDGLIAGDYIVAIKSNQFASSAVLNGYSQSTGAVGSSTGGYEPAPNVNTNETNNDDNGTGDVRNGENYTSSGIRLDYAQEPITDGDTSPNSNFSVDFGLFKPSRLGSTIFYDDNKNGQKDGSENGVEGVIVRLYNATTNQEIISTTTDSEGRYLFDFLVAGSYYIKLENLPESYGLTIQNSGGDGADSDFDPTTFRTGVITLGYGASDLTTFGGVVILENTESPDTGTTTVPGITLIRTGGY